MFGARTYVVVIGNMAQIVGPFKSRTEAEAYIETVISTQFRWGGYSTQVVLLSEPEPQR